MKRDSGALPTTTIDLTWSSRWKRYDITVTHRTSGGRHPTVRTLKMEHPLRLEIDEAGARALAQAVMREYAAWLF